MELVCISIPPSYTVFVQELLSTPRKQADQTPPLPHLLQLLRLEVQRALFRRHRRHRRDFFVLRNRSPTHTRGEAALPTPPLLARS